MITALKTMGSREGYVRLAVLSREEGNIIPSTIQSENFEEMIFTSSL